MISFTNLICSDAFWDGGFGWVWVLEKETDGVHCPAARLRLVRLVWLVWLCKKKGEREGIEMVEAGEKMVRDIRESLEDLNRLILFIVW